MQQSWGNFGKVSSANSTQGLLKTPLHFGKRVREVPWCLWSGLFIKTSYSVVGIIHETHGNESWALMGKNRINPSIHPSTDLFNDASNTFWNTCLIEKSTTKFTTSRKYLNLKFRHLVGICMASLNLSMNWISSKVCWQDYQTPDLQVRPGGLQTWLILFRIKFSSIWVGRWWQCSEGIDSKLQRGKKEKGNEVSVLEETNKLRTCNKYHFSCNSVQMKRSGKRNDFLTMSQETVYVD